MQLIKVDDGFQLWGETYDRTLDDIFAVQDDIAQAVVTQLRGALLDNADAISNPHDIAEEIANANAYRGAKRRSTAFIARGALSDAATIHRGDCARHRAL